MNQGNKKNLEIFQKRIFSKLSGKKLKSVNKGFISPVEIIVIDDDDDPIEMGQENTENNVDINRQCLDNEDRENVDLQQYCLSSMMKIHKFHAINHGVNMMELNNFEFREVRRRKEKKKVGRELKIKHLQSSNNLLEQIIHPEDDLSLSLSGFESSSSCSSLSSSTTFSSSFDSDISDYPSPPITPPVSPKNCQICKFINEHTFPKETHDYNDFQSKNKTSTAKVQTFNLPSFISIFSPYNNLFELNNEMNNSLL
jgi:hypothetical protein